MGRVRLLTVGALEVLHGELNLECLLKERVCLNFLLHGKLEFNSARMWLRPDEGGVQEFDAFQARHVLEAKGEELGGLELAEGPGRPQVAIAIAAMLQDELLGNALSNVNLTLKTVDAGICRVCLGHDATDTAANHRNLEHCLVDGSARDGHST